jgi:predicted aspartyl protease
LGALSLAACAPRSVLVNLTGQPSPSPEGADEAAGADAALRMTAAVRVNGQGPFTFVIDTGANRTVLSVELAQQLGLPPGEPANVHGVAGVEPAPTARVDLLEVQTVASRGITAPLLPRSRLGVDGLLGVDVLLNRRVVMNYLRGELIIEADRGGVPTPYGLKRQGLASYAADLGEAIVVPARYRFGQLIIVGADVARRPVTAFLDTGSEATVGNNALRRLVADSQRLPKAVRERTQVLSATGQVAEGELGEMPLLKIGGLTITGLRTVYADLHVFDLWELLSRPSLLLGMDVLRQFNAVEINYLRRTVTFYLKSGFSHMRP